MMKLARHASPQPPNTLTVEEKADIFYDNAAKFLGLTADAIARHHR